jgi:hypothetical protein
MLKNHRMPINLKSLSRTQDAEVGRMLAGIRGESRLWTAEMRAAMRGGKCKMTSVASDQSDSE